MPWKLGEKIIREGRSWIGSNGVQYSSAWGKMTDDEKKKAGLKWEDDPKPNPDNRFYKGWDSSGKNLIERSIDDQDVTDSEGNKVKDASGNQVKNEGLKTVAIKNAKTIARARLSQTDWMVIRKADEGTEIPDSVKNYRTAIRSACKTIEDAISACDSHAKFVALYEIPDGGKVAPINDWPDEI